MSPDGHGIVVGQGRAIRNFILQHTIQIIFQCIGGSIVYARGQMPLPIGKRCLRNSVRSARLSPICMNASCTQLPALFYISALAHEVAVLPARVAVVPSRHGEAAGEIEAVVVRNLDPRVAFARETVGGAVVAIVSRCRGYVAVQYRLETIAAIVRYIAVQREID